MGIRAKALVRNKICAICLFILPNGRNGESERVEDADEGNKLEHTVHCCSRYFKEL